MINIVQHLIKSYVGGMVLLWSHFFFLQNKLKKQKKYQTLIQPLVSPPPHLPLQFLEGLIELGPVFFPHRHGLSSLISSERGPFVQPQGSQVQDLIRSLYRQARLSSLTSARRLLIMVAKKRAKSTLLMSMQSQSSFSTSNCLEGYTRVWQMSRPQATTCKGNVLKERSVLYGIILHVAN